MSLVSLVSLAALAWGRDTDADGVEDAADLCPLVPDPAQADLDADGSGDACDVCAGEGNGLERFDAGVAVEVETVQWISATDLDADGDEDLVAGFVAHENLGGAFGAAVVGGWGSLAEVADLDGDGLPDVVSLLAGSRIVWSRNAGGLAFDPPVDVSDPEMGTSRIVLADLDADGRIDVVSSSFNLGVGWRRNLGGGSFAARAPIDATPAYGLTAAEIDGDGLTDLVVVHSSTAPESVVWLRNLGGTFAAPVAVERDSLVVDAITAGDLDGDGLDDLVAEVRGEGVVRYRNVDGRFVVAREELVPPNLTQLYTGPEALADVDADGDVDLVAGDGDPAAHVMWRENLGLGELAPARTFATITGVAAIASVDVDLDGWPDLALGSDAGADRGTWWFPTRTCAILDTDVDGVADCQELLRAGSDPGLADTDGDGLSDGEEVLLGSDPRYRDTDLDGAEDAVDGCPADPLDDADGDGVCADRDTCPTDRDPAQGDRDGDAFGDACDLCLGDDATGNSDGDAWCDGVDACDLVPGKSLADGDEDGAGDACDVCGAASTGLEVLSVRSTEVLPCRGFEGCSTAPTSMWSADLDGDGDDDLVYQNGPGVFVEPTLKWLERTGPSSWANDASTLGIQVEELSALVAVDVDGDGDDDLLTADRRRDRVELHPNVGVGRPSFPVHVVLSTTDDPTSLAVADLDTDGDLDAVATFGRPDEVALFENQGATAVVHPLANGLGHPRGVAALDLDGDGDDDLAVSTRDGVGWLENLGGSTFAAPAPLAAPLADAEWLEAADVDGDGDDDLVVVALHAGVSWLRNDGVPPFATTSLVVGDALGADTGDLDGDGDPDVVVQLGGALSDPATAVGYLENRQGRFDVPEWHAGLPDAILLAEASGDQLLDLVLGAYGSLSYDAALVCALRDGDGDGLHDGEELLVTGTDIARPDTDGGGRTDEQEVIFDGTDPRDPSDDLP